MKIGGKDEERKKINSKDNGKKETGVQWSCLPKKKKPLIRHAK